MSQRRRLRLRGQPQLTPHLLRQTLKAPPPHQRRNLPTPQPPATAAPEPEVPFTRLARVEIEPPAATVNIVEATRFTFRAFDDAGDEMTDVLANWSVAADVGEIDATGLFTPSTTAGPYFGAGKVEVVSGRYRANTAADVAIVPDSLSTLELIPSQITVERDTTLPLRAKGYDRYGNEITGLKFIWEATPGLTINNQEVVKKTVLEASARLVGWWRGEGNARDSAGSNHGSVVNGTDYVPGVSGTAFGFDGVDQYINVNPSAELNITGDVTVSLWVNRTVLGTRAVVIAKGGGGVNNVDVPSVFVLIFGDTKLEPAGPGEHLSALFERMDATNVQLVNPQPTTTAFHHYTYVREGDAHTLFEDGEIVANETFTGTPGDTSSLPLMIGNIKNDADPLRFSFGGIIDEVRVYNRALSGPEIKAIFDADNPNARHSVTVRAIYKNSERAVTVEVHVTPN